MMHYRLSNDFLMSPPVLTSYDEITTNIWLFLYDLHIQVPNSIQLVYDPVLLFCATTPYYYDGFPP